MMLSCEPKRAAEKSETMEPTRAKLLSENALPRCTQSNTDICDPKRVTPKVAMLDPIRARLLSAKALPMCTKSKTDIALAQRMKLRRLNELPKCT
jgi:hypothetical protein